MSITNNNKRRFYICLHIYNADILRILTALFTHLRMETVLSVVFERLLKQHILGWRTTEQKSVKNKLIKAIIPKIIQYQQGLRTGNESLFPYCIDLSEFYTSIINILYYNILLYLCEEMIT